MLIPQIKTYLLYFGGERNLLFQVCTLTLKVQGQITITVNTASKIKQNKIFERFRRQTFFKLTQYVMYIIVP